MTSVNLIPGSQAGDGAQGFTAPMSPRSYFVHKAGIWLGKSNACMVLNDDGQVGAVCTFLFGFGCLLC